MGTSDFTALDISSWKTTSSSPASNLRNNCPMKAGKKYSRGINVYHLLLLISALLSTTTFQIQLKILGCRAEEAYEYNSSLLSSFCQVANQHPYFILSVIVFNSLAFFISVALIMILCSGLPLWPLSLVSAFSMAAAYMCTISDPLKPLLSSSSLVSPLK